jgi:phosphohistidine phosphatase
MKIFLLRHGIAFEHGTPGFKESARPLTAKGERKMRQIAKAMRAMNLDFDVVLSSPLVRTRQTAEIVTEALRMTKLLKFSDALMPEGNQKQLIQLLQRIRPLPKNVLLVGHEPYLSQFLSLLVTGNFDSQFEMKKGGLCKITVERLKASRCAVLEWLLTPRQMERMV